MIAPNAEMKALLQEWDVTETERLIAAAELGQPLRNGWTLYTHQKEAVTAILQRRRVILAFDMGLGKTLISLVAAPAWQKVGRCCCIQ